jgi:dTDP-4-amino-4,6-dideoxygalactose transaminase
MNIPLIKPYIGREEIESVSNVLKNGRICGDGKFGKMVESEIKKLCGSKYSLFTTSCTHALELALMTLNIGTGDEVILPSFTFVSCANAVILQGAKPVFAEIDPDTFNINPDDINRVITDRTKVIMPVHYGGVACRMDEIVEIAKKKDIYIIEDAAQAIGSKYKGKYLGTIGNIGCYSFHETKNITCGEGGALVTDSEDIWKKGEIMREKGTNRAAFFRGEVDKYRWIDRGSSYINSDILGAVLYEQFKKIDEIMEKRRIIYEFYKKSFIELSEEEKVYFQKIPDFCEQNYHLFAFRVRDEKERDRCLKELRERGIGASFHFIPLHSSPYGKKLGYKEEDLPITEMVSRTLIRLPIYPDLKSNEMEYIVESVIDILKN